LVKYSFTDGVWVVATVAALSLSMMSARRARRHGQALGRTQVEVVHARLLMPGMSGVSGKPLGRGQRNVLTCPGPPDSSAFPRRRRRVAVAARSASTSAAEPF